MKKALVMWVLGWLIPTCTMAQPDDGPDIIRTNQHGYLSQLFGYSIPDSFDPGLYLAVSEWLGTPYRYAGAARSGVDCSGFVRLVYAEAYGTSPAGNSRTLYATSRRIPADSLREGDLVFFRTRRHQVSHVGIYLGNGKFVHSSRSLGVTVSELSESYYRKRFAGARRPEPTETAAGW